MRHLHGTASVPWDSFSFMGLLAHMTWLHETGSSSKGQPMGPGSMIESSMGQLHLSIFMGLLMGHGTTQWD